MDRVMYKCCMCDKDVTLVSERTKVPVYYMVNNGRTNWYCSCKCGVFHKENNYRPVVEMLMHIVNEEEIEKFLETYKL